MLFNVIASQVKFSNISNQYLEVVVEIKQIAEFIAKLNRR